MSLKHLQPPGGFDTPSEPPQKRRRSSGPLSDQVATPTALRESHDHEVGAKEHHERRTRDHGKDNTTTQASSARLASQAVAPFLTRHIPNQYAPLGNTNGENTNAPKDPNSKFCYRHRPDMLCRRQADEPSMDKLQKVRANPSKTTILS
jgi:F-box/WD-40 domain protein MET30